MRSSSNVDAGRFLLLTASSSADGFIDAGKDITCDGENAPPADPADEQQGEHGEDEVGHRHGERG